MIFLIWSVVSLVNLALGLMVVQAGGMSGLTFASLMGVIL